MAIGVAVYYLLPHEWVKAAWGVGIGLAGYLALAWLQALLFPRTRAGIEPAESPSEDEKPEPAARLAPDQV